MASRWDRAPRICRSAKHKFEVPIRKTSIKKLRECHPLFPHNCCVRDRRNYQKIAANKSEQALWVDITDRDAELEQLGTDPQKALTELHITTADGQILSELDAYIVLME